MVQKVVDGLRHPTEMAFLGPKEILVLEKDTGQVRRVANDSLLHDPLMTANVSIGNAGRGLLGIAITKISNQTYVFLSFIESSAGKPTDDVKIGKKPLGNRLYRYELINDKLVHPKLFLSVTAWPGDLHYGGPIVIGPDQNVYWMVGDDGPAEGHTSQAQNIKNAPADGTGGILRFTLDGRSIGNGILGSQYPLKLYYAYGIRNSFGMAFDPVTKKLWDTENGPNYGDELNLVEPGFNSGWTVIQGMLSRAILLSSTNFDAALSMDKPTNRPLSNMSNQTLLDKLVNFGGRGIYRDPKLEWKIPVAPTAICFLNSDKLGKQFQNDMFVGDFVNGRIYHFKLDPSRTGLADLSGSLRNKVVEKDGELQNETFGAGFNGITDIKVGPDGYLYILSYNDGSIYRIIPVSVFQPSTTPLDPTTGYKPTNKANASHIISNNTLGASPGIPGLLPTN